MTRLRLQFLAPAALVVVTLLVAPLLVVLAYSLMSRGVYGGVEAPYTLENYSRLFDSLYVAILFRSFVMAAAATVVCLLLAFPLALFISRAARRKRLLLHLVMIPFWTSFLVRTYAWMFLLRDTGLFNTILLGLGLIAEPLPLLYNPGAVLLGLVYGYLPFMVLPLYASLERLDRSLIEAARDLYAPGWAVFTRVIVPLAKPGIAAGCLLVFIPSLGAYLTPDLLGGARSMMIGNFIQHEYLVVRDWPLGSAASLVLLATVLAGLWGYQRTGGLKPL